MLDDVEGVGEVVTGREGAGVEVGDGRRQPAVLQAPAQVAGARVVEVGEGHLVARLEQELAGVERRRAAGAR